jgi:hypothetical protein
MKKFFVSKSDQAKVAFIKEAIEKVNPKNVFILAEKSRVYLFNGIDATVMPLKEINKNENWIEFSKSICPDSMLIIDNILKFVFFGDGKKKYLKDISQSINNVIVMDVVPFYTEPHEIFYPFWFLGKEVLGYNSYNTFKANHLEEKESGESDYSHSFEVLKEKIKDYYIQDYRTFFNERRIVKWQMSDDEFKEYEKRKMNSDFKNPIKLITTFADYINLLASKASAVDGVLLGKTAIVINYMPYAKKISAMLPIFSDVDFVSYHETSPEKFSQYYTIVFYDNIIVKPHILFYIEPNIKGQCYCLIETSVNLDTHLFNRIYNIELREQFNSFFYGTNL